MARRHEDEMVLPKCGRDQEWTLCACKILACNLELLSFYGLWEELEGGIFEEMEASLAVLDV